MWLFAFLMLAGETVALALAGHTADVNINPRPGFFAFVVTMLALDAAWSLVEYASRWEASAGRRLSEARYLALGGGTLGVFAVVCAAAAAGREPWLTVLLVVSVADVVVSLWWAREAFGMR